AVDLVRQRAAAMQNAVAPGVGAMAAVLGLSDEQVEQACTAAATENEVVEPVNYNAPGQVVVAGHAAAVNRAVEAARASGARRAVLLPVSVPSHSSLMQPAAHALEQAVATADLQTPTTTVVSSVDATVYRDAEHIRANLLSQVHQPVRWVATVNALVALGGGTVIECGPGKVLTGLNRRITKGSDTNCAAIIDPASLTDVQQMVKPQ
ncbi:MAG: ACP S-malonyltransferase, partial [Gammaproteobacteria bacterium]|nr:ACP S-malonyltransferase [Gammaproteobacteria bacterium]